MAIKKVAVVGGGVAGMVTCASLKEAGMEPICFEWTDKPGGTWCYREHSEEGIPSLMNSTVINHSKEIGAFSNFPPRKEHNNYMRHEEMLEYVMEYATAKDVLRHIRCNSKVTEIKRAEDYDESGSWMVTVKDMLSGKETTDTYDACVICVGHCNRPKMPTYPGQEKFKGKIMHTHSLKRVDEFKDKNVVVIGMGCSGLDAAVESSNVAKQVYLSTTTGAHVVNRVSRYGRPYDLVVVSRFLSIFLAFSFKISSWFLEMYINQFFHTSLYAVPPKQHLFQKDPIFNDHIFSKILSGSVIQTKGIKYFTETGVVFEGERKEVKVDVVIMATGYTYGFPFLEEGVLEVNGNIIKLYQCMFPTNLPHATLGFVGFFLPWGPGFPLGEMQSRCVAQVFSTVRHLPPKEVMDKDVMDRYKKNVARYGASEKTSLRIDYVTYLDDLASSIGAKPNLLRLFFTDILLFIKIYFGPNFAYQYRLEGPHSWSGAREAVMTAEKRIMWPLKRSEEAPHQNFILKWLKISSYY